MKKIYKHPVRESFSVMMPANARVVHVEVQDRTPTLWFEFTVDEPLVERRFEVYGTGHDIPDDAAYIATFQQPPYVWHLYERV